MKSALEGPLEALALDYLGLGFLTAINNIWTWVAVMAGAVSFLVSIRKPALSITAAVLPDSEVQNLDPVPEPDHSFYSPATSAEALTPSSRAEGEAVDWATRRKFTVYYEDDLAEAGEENYFAGVGEEYDVNMVAKDRTDVRIGQMTISRALDWNQLNELCLSGGKLGLTRLDYVSNRWEWDAMLRMRISTGDEMGWYNYQDLTMINGNVVRLWESCRD